MPSARYELIRTWPSAVNADGRGFVSSHTPIFQDEIHRYRRACVAEIHRYY